MFRFIVDLLQARQRVSNTHRCLLHFTERDLEDVGLTRADAPCFHWY